MSVQNRSAGYARNETKPEGHTGRAKRVLRCHLDESSKVPQRDRIRDNEVRLQLHVTYKLATLLRRKELPEALGDGSLTSLQL